MISLTYVSVATREMSKDDLLDLLRECVRKNQAEEITGMLLYKGGKFMQILEGPDAAVRKVFAGISQDKRHSSIIKIFEGPIRTRLFPTWSMGFRDLNTMKAEEIPGYDGFLNEEPVGKIFPLDSARANTLLRMFQQVG